MKTWEHVALILLAIFVGVVAGNSLFPPPAEHPAAVSCDKPPPQIYHRPAVSVFRPVPIQYFHVPRRQVPPAPLPSATPPADGKIIEAQGLATVTGIIAGKGQLVISVDWGELNLTRPIQPNDQFEISYVAPPQNREVRAVRPLRRSMMRVKPRYVGPQAPEPPYPGPLGDDDDPPPRALTPDDPDWEPPQLPPDAGPPPGWKRPESDDDGEIIEAHGTAKYIGGNPSGHLWLSVDWHDRKQTRPFRVGDYFDIEYEKPPDPPPGWLPPGEQRRAEIKSVERWDD